MQLLRRGKNPRADRSRAKDMNCGCDLWLTWLTPQNYIDALRKTRTGLQCLLEQPGDARPGKRTMWGLDTYLEQGFGLVCKRGWKRNRMTRKSRTGSQTTQNFLSFWPICCIPASSSPVYGKGIKKCSPVSILLPDSQVPRFGRALCGGGGVASAEVLHRSVQALPFVGPGAPIVSAVHIVPGATHVKRDVRQQAIWQEGGGGTEGLSETLLRTSLCYQIKHLIAMTWPIS